MHILYIHQHFSTPKGPAGTRSYEFAKKLVDSGHQVTMICGSNSRADTGAVTKVNNKLYVGEVSGFKVLEVRIPYSNHDSLLSRVRKFFSFSFYSTKLALTEKYDLIFSTSTPLTVSIPGIVAKIFRQKPFVFEVRDLWPELPKAMGVIKNPLVIWMMSVLEKAAYKSADALIGLSPGIVSGIKKITPNKMVAEIPNGCDIDFFSQGVAKELLGFSKNDFIAIFSGAHGVANGLDSVLDAALILKKNQVRHIKFLFVGDGKLKPHLQERAKKEKLMNCVFWEPVPKIELGSILRSVDLGLMVLDNIPAFYYGTSPNKFFDYIASGLPVLNNYPGWVSELILSYQCGSVVEPNNPEQFAEALESLAAFPEQIGRMRHRSSELAEQFNRSKLSEQFVNYIERVYEEAI